MLKKNSKILLYGGKSTALIVSEMLKDNGINPKYIFDQYIKKLPFKSNAKFSNNKKDLEKFIEKSDLFFVCIGMLDGKLRHKISQILRKKGLKQFSLISKDSLIDKTSIFCFVAFLCRQAFARQLGKLGTQSKTILSMFVILLLHCLGRSRIELGVLWERHGPLFAILMVNQNTWHLLPSRRH